jgi:phosphoribosyl 1,2-cyclic phosphodiesterase
MGLSINRLLYISDASKIPEDSYETISKLKVDVLIIDCLRPREHISHFGLAKSIEATRRINAPKTYFIGFAHDITHDDWERIGRALETGDWEEVDLPKAIIDAMEYVPREPYLWVRPSYDGLLLRVEA